MKNTLLNLLGLLITMVLGLIIIGYMADSNWWQDLAIVCLTIATPSGIYITVKYL